MAKTLINVHIVEEQNDTEVNIIVGRNKGVLVFPFPKPAEKEQEEVNEQDAPEPNGAGKQG